MPSDFNPFPNIINYIDICTTCGDKDMFNWWYCILFHEQILLLIQFQN